ncbi:CBS domain-containing protein [Beggiatoa alba B18LD]|uniref:CBS domain-containing protein n=1 Tax=Beggiatoa alba B18LD TaxID=395493 RepID=I3CFT3_9GAMM|nr:hemolysin family protein [Beggiatoa alba]EIJ42476.1 CBS domain-containing protein [Beggiatoa alba B18LD]
MSSISYEIFFILVLVVLNGIFAMSEMAIVSSRKSRLQRLINEGDKKAIVALQLANEPNRFLSTVQIGITLIGILAGAFGGATISEKLSNYIKNIDFLAPYSDFIGLGIVVLIITYLSLIVGELVPKRIALNNPERIAKIVAIPMSWLSIIATPLVFLLSLSTEKVLKFLGMYHQEETPVTEEEIKDLIEQGTQAGMFHEAEQVMVDRIFRFADRRITEVMTPRVSLVSLNIEDDLSTNREKILEKRHSQFPVCQNNIDNILGVIHVKDLLSSLLTTQQIDLQSGLIEPLFFSENMSALKALDLFKQSGKPVAFVVDEYGNIEGMVTLNDIFASVVGNIELQEEDPSKAVQRADGSWLLDGMMPIDEVKDVLQLQKLPDEEKNYYRTLAGFVLTHLGDIPHVADYFEWNGLRFEIVDMDGKRIDKILVTLVS